MSSPLMISPGKEAKKQNFSLMVQSGKGPLPSKINVYKSKKKQKRKRKEKEKRKFCSGLLINKT